MNFRKVLTISLRLAALFFALHLPLFGQGSTFIVYAQGTGTGGSGNATALQGVPVATTLPGAGQCLGYNGTTWAPVGCTGAGGGTVTGFSSGNLAPLFSTSVATATSTPSQTFSLSTALADTVFGNCTGSTAAPSFCTLVSAQIPIINLASSSAGGVSGLLPHANIAATAVTPGPYTNANITVAADGSITAAANGSGGGGTPCTTTALSIQYNSAGSFGCEPDLTFNSPHTLTLGASGIITLTAGATLNGITSAMIPTLNQNTTGNAATATNLTGCTGAAAGDICYYTGSAWAKLTGNITSTQYLQETSSGVPSWTTPSGSGNTTSTSLTTNTLPKANGANSIINSSVSDNGTTVSTTEPISAGASMSTTTDGVHPSSVQLAGNTTLPTLTTNTVTFLGPPSATPTAYSIQVPTAIPATTDFLSCTTTSTNCLLTDTGIPATATGLNTTIKTLTGCNTATFVYTPQAAECVAQSGGSGAPATVTLLSKTATYAGASGDYSSGTAPPTLVEFSLSAIGQTYTLLSSAPALVSGNMPCTTVKNVTAPYILAVLTGGSTTLDGLAFASVGFPVGPGQAMTVCSDGTNYHTVKGLSVSQSLTASVGGVYLPFEGLDRFANNAPLSANGPQVWTFNLNQTVKISNITFEYTGSTAGATCDAGLYDSSGNLLVHIGSTACATATNAFVKAAATTAIILPPGIYSVAECASSVTVTFANIDYSGFFGAMVGPSGAATRLGGATSANTCTAGVLPATLGALTHSDNLNSGVPAIVVSP